MKQRVQKIIAASGYCSRRKAEEFIKEGRVTVNQEKITLGDSADPEKDEIKVGKQTIVIEDHLYLMLHKPINYLCTKADLFGRRTIMELVEGLPRSVYPVGRLDRDARGLIIMSSDGDFTQKVLHPSHKLTKTYQAQVDRPITRSDLTYAREGVTVEGRRTKAFIKKIKPKLVEITISEGRNKIVKKLMNKLGYYVTDLKRVRIGEVKLNVKEGRWRELTTKEIEMLTTPQTRPRKTQQNQKRKSTRHPQAPHKDNQRRSNQNQSPRQW